MTSEIGRIPQALWEQTPNNVFRTDLTPERFDQLERLRANTLRFDEICRISYGAQISSKEKGAFGREQFLSGKADGLAQPKKFYEGRDMKPFAMSWSGQYVDMAARDEMYGPRTPGFFEAEKLSVRHISGNVDSFVAWIDEDGYYTDHGVIHAVPYAAIAHEKTYQVTDQEVERSEKYPLFYLLGILMSQTVMELYAELYATGSLQGAFSHVYPQVVKALPVPPLENRPPAVADDWMDTLFSGVPAGRLSAAAVRRTFKGRLEVAGALTRAACERQETEMRRISRNREFASFMQMHSKKWAWRRGESLDHPPIEADLMSRIKSDVKSVKDAETIRVAFDESVSGASKDRERAAKLQSALNSLSTALFRAN